MKLIIVGLGENELCDKWEEQMLLRPWDRRPLVEDGNDGRYTVIAFRDVVRALKALKRYKRDGSMGAALLADEIHVVIGSVEVVEVGEQDPVAAADVRAQLANFDEVVVQSRIDAAVALLEEAGSAGDACVYMNDIEYICNQTQRERPFCEDGIDVRFMSWANGVPDGAPDVVYVIHDDGNAIFEENHGVGRECWTWLPLSEMMSD